MELQQTSLSTFDDEDLDYNGEKDLEYEESTESVHTIPQTRRRRTSSSEEVSQRTESTELITPEELARMQDDMAQLRDHVRAQSGFDVVSESPLTRAVETARIDRTLKIPSIDQFDGSSDPSGFLNTFDGRMALYGHSEITRCQFFSTCLQGTSLRWYNNLPP